MQEQKKQQNIKKKDITNLLKTIRLKYNIY